MLVASQSPEPSSESSLQSDAAPSLAKNALVKDAAGRGTGRRLAGIAALFACALMVDPARIVPEITALPQIDSGIAMHALVIPALAMLGLWLVIPNAVVLAMCVLMLAGAHTELGHSDLFAGYLYPVLAACAGAYLIKSLLFANAANNKKQQLGPPQ